MLVVLMAYSLFDRKLREYGAIGLERNQEACIRSLVDGIKGSGGMVEKYPEDFDLYHVGEFDNEVGIFTAENPPVLVDSMADILPPVLEE